MSAISPGIREAGKVGVKPTGTGGTGDVTGPGSSTDNAIARFDGTGGKTLQNTGVLIDDNNKLTLPDSSTYPPLNVTERNSAPSTPASGDIYLDDGANTASGGPGWRRYNGSTWEDVSAGAGGSGYPFDSSILRTVDFNSGTAEYSTVATAEAASSSGNTIEVGVGSNDEATLSIDVAVKIIGKGIDATTITSNGTDYRAIAISDAAVTIERLTAASTGSFASICTGIEINSSSAVTLRGVKATAAAASTTATGILCAGAATHTLYDCDSRGSSGSTNYGLSVQSGCTVVIEKGYYSGSTFAIINNGGTLTLRGPYLANGISGTWTGWYYDSNGDLHVDGDEAGIKARTVDIYQTSITDHFDDGTFSGFTWALATPSTVSETTFPSLLTVGSTATERAFAYQSAGTTITCRCTAPLEVRTGLRCDNGGTNNYVELFLELDSSTGLINIKRRYAVGGSVTGPTTLVTGLPASMFCILRMIQSSGNWLLYYSINSPVVTFLETVTALSAVTMTRTGLYHEHTSGTFGGTRTSLWDWYKQS